MYGTGDEKWFAAAEPLGPIERFRSGIWQHIFYDPKLILVMLGPALLGVPVCLWLLWRKEYLFIVGGALGMSIPYFAHLFVEIPLAHRFLLFVMFFLHLALVWLILRAIDYWQTLPAPQYAGLVRFAVLGSLGVAVLANIVLLAIEFRGYTISPTNLKLSDKRGQMPEGMSVVELFSRLTAPVPDSAVVLTTPQLGWALPTVKAKVVSLYHENPMVLDQAERFRLTTQFFQDSMDEQARTDIVRSYNATHVLINIDDSSFSAPAQAWIASHGKGVVDVGPYRMYELDYSTLGSASAPVADAPLRDERQSTRQMQPEASRGSRESERTDAPAAASAQSVADEPAPGEPGFGAPIAAPLIAQPPPSADPESLESIIQAQPEAALAPTADDESAAGAEPVTPRDAEGTDNGSFGAPITDPMLDPERHGG